MNKIRKIMIMSGGTGGHVFSGLVIARYLIDYYGWQVKWLGSFDGIEATLVPQNGIDIKYIKVRGIIGKKLIAKLITLLGVLKAIKRSRKIMKIWKPDIVLGMGGYVSGPSCLAAWIIGIPIVIHEQNVIAGFTNRILSRIATKVLQAFPYSLPNAEVVGNPIRHEILSLPDPIKRLRCRHGPIRVLVFGGSQGSHILNKIIPEVMIKMFDKFIVLHQVGSKSLKKVRDIYSFGSIDNYEVVSFIDDMASAYAWADIVISRSGALTVSEIAAVGLAAVFVPFMHSDNHQYWNAMFLQKIGAAKIIKESECTIEQISEIFITLNDRKVLLNMAQCAKKLCVTDAVKRIAQVLISI
ncbi:undecaprenyldiphospho-muramoylpentapeptide beta-N-acetylglucosaminyltransferase [Blochmannia endosymbiont of Camponotus (Colobopsis) obliquus]|uniref:undecaprenyldiphospho-muramoylpentapeptide beta-N-acetylglucosaminyltransferase n=1 Tax=Blochmannia endosymbiont of Camponotus (Colobopsis) obliquus TaxID=1505597 RepID=UPI00061A71A8|nr:undecaprenyldiphospho-muramoylpentapeptide beta-N-acetylglucosaminyltransferase [Blochmannia endosymbiont of Camponotus (Colobopsis) obliquus]AKC60317.1 UDP-N-acetylglucosamine--N-acetylmuramyl-(pentapeptide) pyrophosphoryl-undecaprenol N-acetylglucosamine transferase [Blochmannia endosymbiont of Camponotus (Colobopsis) obliquus]